MVRIWKRMMPLCLLAALLIVPAAQAASEGGGKAPQQEWEIIVPTGEIQKARIDPAPRITSLDGKTVVLRWNGKNNGDVALNHLGDLLKKKYPTVKIVKSYEQDPGINIISASTQNSEKITTFIKGLKPDLVIAAQAD
jgi:hypothetical protein